MKCLFPNLFRAGLLLSLLLAPGELIAQETQSTQAPAAATAVPELADLIPLTTVLSARLATLEKLIAGQGDRSRIEQQLRKISAAVDGYIEQFSVLKASNDPRAGRLPHLKAEIGSAGDALAEVNKAVTAKVRTLGNLRKVWLAEQQQWIAWQAALRKEEPPEEITTTVTKAQEVIGTALGLLLQQLRPLLIVQEQIGAQQTKINTLTAAV